MAGVQVERSELHQAATLARSSIAPPANQSSPSTTIQGSATASTSASAPQASSTGTGPIPTSTSAPPATSSQYSAGQVCGTAGNGGTETYRGDSQECYWGTGSFTPQDENPNDASASQCPGDEIGPHADCYVAQHLAQDYTNGNDGTSWTDTETEGNDTIHYNCWQIGQYTYGSGAGIYLCTDHDSQNWVEWSFT